MSGKTYEVSVTAIFTINNTEELYNIVKQIEASSIINKAVEYSINTNINTINQQNNED